MIYAREAAGLSEGQVARRLGVKKETIADWEADRSEPRSNKLQILAGVLGVSFGWLLAGAGDRPAGEAKTEDDSIRDELDRLRADAARLVERIDAIGGQIERRGTRRH